MNGVGCRQFFSHLTIARINFSLKSIKPDFILRRHIFTLKFRFGFYSKQNVNLC